MFVALSHHGLRCFGETWPKTNHKDVCKSLTNFAVVGSNCSVPPDACQCGSTLRACGCRRSLPIWGTSLVTPSAGDKTIPGFRGLGQTSSLSFRPTSLSTPADAGPLEAIVYSSLSTRGSKLLVAYRIALRIGRCVSSLEGLPRGGPTTVR